MTANFSAKKQKNDQKSYFVDAFFAKFGGFYGGKIEVKINRTNRIWR